MPQLDSHTTIPKDVSSNDDLDFEFLKREGLKYLQSFSGKLWTDYNSHDPGVTILENLSFALTDLAQRIEQPMVDLMTTEGNTSSLGKQFAVAHKILPTAPVTAKDYRKLFIDEKGVKNAWMHIYDRKVFVDCKNDKLSYNSATIDPLHLNDFDIKGLYTVIIDFDEFDPDSTELTIDEWKGEIKTRLLQVYNANRNLCEDVYEIKEIESEPIGVCTELELESDADEEWVKAKVIRVIHNYYSPPITRYTLGDLLAKGHETDQIYDGPLLSNGFITDEDLANSELRTQVRLSDLMRLISAIDGVKLIKDITINRCDGDSDEREWVICIEPGKKPAYCDKSSFSFFKDVIPLNIEDEKVDGYLKQLMQEEADEIASIASVSNELEIEEGVYTPVGEYSTIQNTFPEVYGIGRYGITKDFSDERIAKAKQLKAYLSFFDQILANYFKQLENIRDILSVSGDSSNNYAFKVLEDVVDLDTIVTTDYNVENEDEIGEKLFDQLYDPKKKQNEILDHLIARFSESFNQYVFLLKNHFGEFTEDAVIKAKRSLLKNYEEISTKRGLAYNHTLVDDLWDSSNVSFIQKRLGFLSSIANTNRRNLSTQKIELSGTANLSGGTDYSWVLKNDQNEVIAHSTQIYTSEESLHLDLFRIQEFIRVENNFEIIDNGGGTFYYQLIDPAKVAEPNSVKSLVRLTQLFDSLRDATKNRNAILDLINCFNSSEGMFLIEHINLLPYDNEDFDLTNAYFLPVCTENCNACGEIDPYSYRLSIVLPGWGDRFGNKDFRDYFETMVSRELPAHILPRVCWIGYPKDSDKEDNDMVELESTYRAFLKDKATLTFTQRGTPLKNLIQSISNMDTIYQKGNLTDCDSEEPDRAILGRTNI